MNAKKLEKAVEITESLSLSDQKILRAVLSDQIYKKKPAHQIKNNEDPSALISSGLVILIDDPSGLVFAPEYFDVGRKLCTYLTRRNETESYFDPDRGMEEIPKGSRFVSCVSMHGGSSLRLAFPDDDVTELLDRYGVNRCRDREGES